MAFIDLLVYAYVKAKIVHASIYILYVQKQLFPITTWVY